MRKAVQEHGIPMRLYVRFCAWPPRVRARHGGRDGRSHSSGTCPGPSLARPALRARVPAGGATRVITRMTRRVRREASLRRHKRFGSSFALRTKVPSASEVACGITTSEAATVACRAGLGCPTGRMPRTCAHRTEAREAARDRAQRGGGKAHARAHLHPLRALLVLTAAGAHRARKPATALMYMMCLAAIEPVLSGFEMAKICLSARTIQHIHKYDM